MVFRPVTPEVTITVPTHIIISAKRAVQREKGKLETWLNAQEGRPSEKAMTMTEVAYLTEFLEAISKAQEEGSTTT